MKCVWPSSSTPALQRCSRLAASVVIFILVSGCQNDTRPRDFRSILISLERTACYGEAAVFEGTVVRIQAWSQSRLSCGGFANYRLVEYRVEAVYAGKLRQQQVGVKHLACNYNELDELRIGDRVLVVAESLPNGPETLEWAQDQQLAQYATKNKINISFEGRRVARVIYPN